jgi:glycosyltransferase involved in cell wall biosynthesis
MLRAVRLLLDRGCDVTLSIAGDGDDESMAALRLGIRDLHLDHHVRLLGRCRRAEVPEIVAGADVFVLSSLSEGISNAVLEAMAMGRPVVVTAAGGMAEAVRDGVDGYVVPTRQPHALADAIERLGDAAERRNEMGDAAAAHVRQSFTIKHHIERFCALYEEATR